MCDCKTHSTQISFFSIITINSQQSKCRHDCPSFLLQKVNKNSSLIVGTNINKPENIYKNYTNKGIKIKGINSFGVLQFETVSNESLIVAFAVQ